MKFLNTQLPLVIFYIIILETIILFTQIIQYLTHSAEKSRLYHIYLFILLILYNVSEGFFPDENINWVPGKLQNFLGYGFGYVFAAYCPVYFDRSMGLKSMKFHGQYGFLFVLIPTIFFYGILYPINGDLQLTRKYVYIIPGLYAIWLFSSALIGIIKDFKISGNASLRMERLCYFFAVFPVSITPIFGAYLGFPKWIITTTFNIGFLIVNWILMRQLIAQSKNDYVMLQELTSGAQQAKRTAAEIFEANCQKHHLTNREIEVIRLIKQGYKYKDIAGALFISQRTVAKHLQHIFVKTGTKNKIELIKILET